MMVRVRCGIGAPHPSHSALRSLFARAKPAPGDKAGNLKAVKAVPFVMPLTFTIQDVFERNSLHTGTVYRHPFLHLGRERQDDKKQFNHLNLPEISVPFLIALRLCFLKSILFVNQPSSICVTFPYKEISIFEDHRDSRPCF